MNIRSITLFTNPAWPLQRKVLQTALDFIAEARSAFEDAGFQVQTTRLATPPFPHLLPDCRTPTVISFATQLEEALTASGFDYLSIGPAQPGNPESYAVIPEVIAATENVFASGVMTTPEAGVHLPAVRACAEIIRALSPQAPNGFANLYFAALANVPPGAPFFPAAFHDGGPPMFAIATEAGGLAVEAFHNAENLAAARRNLTRAIETNAHQLTSVASNLIHPLAAWGEIRFGGIDFSLAPFPQVPLSLGTAMEQLGVSRLGLHGSLTAAAFIADTIDRARFPHTGFSGMMLPVLEDSTLAQRAADGSLSIKDLLLFSAVCGTGLDTIPLPGEATPAQLSAVLLDLATLAARLNKPLTARLMPIPGKRAGDPTDFDFPFFANSRVMPLEAEQLTGPLAGEEAMEVLPRPSATT